MKQLALVALAVALLAPAPGRASESLGAFTQRMLALAPENFAAIRGAETSHASYQIAYGVSKAAKTTCTSCTVTNEFSWPGNPENWYLSDEWHASKTWSHAKVASYVLAQLTPLLTGYARATSGSHDYPTYRWHDRKTSRWVLIDTFNGGFTVKIGHDLATATHQLHAATIDDMQTLRSAISNLVKLGTGAASNNFDTLRGSGKRNEIGTMEYSLNVNLGSSLYDCSVSDNTTNELKLDDFSPNWTLDCSTTPLVASIPALLTEVQQAVASAIPSSFSSTTGKLLGLNDFRWDDSTSNTAVTVGSLSGYFLPKGLAEIRVGITHFTQ